MSSTQIRVKGPYRIRLRPTSGGVWEVFSSRGVVAAGRSIKKIRKTCDSFNDAHSHAYSLGVAAALAKAEGGAE